MTVVLTLHCQVYDEEKLVRTARDKWVAEGHDISEWDQSVELFGATETALSYIITPCTPEASLHDWPGFTIPEVFFGELKD